MLASLQESNYTLFDRIQAEPRCSGMGTTLVAAAIERDSMHWVSVGDSPLWLVRNGEIERLNEDHSVAGLLEPSGGTHAEVPGAGLSGSARSELVEAVLGEDIRRVDAPDEALRLSPGDLVLLASDGVETCASDRLCAIAASAADSDRLVDTILDEVASLDRAAQDNATVIALRLNNGGSGESEERPDEQPDTPGSGGQDSPFTTLGLKGERRVARGHATDAAVPGTGGGSLASLALGMPDRAARAARATI